MENFSSYITESKNTYITNIINTVKGIQKLFLESWNS